MSLLYTDFSRSLTSFYICYINHITTETLINSQLRSRMYVICISERREIWKQEVLFCVNITKTPLHRM